MSSSQAVIAPLAILAAEKHTKAIDMNEARHRFGVVSDSSTMPIGSMGDMKTPEIPRSQAIIVTLVA